VNTRATDVHVFRADLKELFPEHLETIIAFQVDHMLPSLLRSVDVLSKFHNECEELATAENFTVFWEALKEPKGWKLDSLLDV
jgi:hypothetical protein